MGFDFCDRATYEVLVLARGAGSELVSHHDQLNHQGHYSTKNLKEKKKPPSVHFQNELNVRARCQNRSLSLKYTVRAIAGAGAGARTSEILFLTKHVLCVHDAMVCIPPRFRVYGSDRRVMRTAAARFS